MFLWTYVVIKSCNLKLIWCKSISCLRCICDPFSTTSYCFLTNYQLGAERTVFVHAEKVVFVLWVEKKIKLMNLYKISGNHALPQRTGVSLSASQSPWRPLSPYPLQMISPRAWGPVPTLPLFFILTTSQWPKATAWPVLFLTCTLAKPVLTPCVNHSFTISIWTIYWMLLRRQSITNLPPPPKKKVIQNVPIASGWVWSHPL